MHPTNGTAYIAMKQTPSLNSSELDNCVLDMDGTLLDLHFDDIVWNVQLPLYYAKKNKCSVETARDYIKSTLERYRGSLDWYSFSHWENKLEIDISSIEMAVLHLVSVKKDTLHFLENAKKREKQLILATNAYPCSMRKKFAITGIDKYFDHVINSHDIGRAKEEAEFWNELRNRLNLENKRTLIVDDNLNVLRAASKCGYSALCAVSHPNSKGEEKHTEEFPSVASLAELL